MASSGLQQGPGAMQGQRQPVVRQPAVDVIDAGDDLVLEIEIPGAEKEKINLTALENQIQLHAGTRESYDDENILQSERGSVTYQRSIALTTPVNADEIHAEFENGILTVRAPKLDPSHGPHRINIQGSGET